MGEGSQTPVSRRRTLALAGGALLGTASLVAGRSSAQTTTTDESQTRHAYVGSYHWGYFVLDEQGTERERLTVPTGTEVRVTAFNVESADAIAALPSAVQNGIPGEQELERRNAQRIPTPPGTDLEALHEAAEAAYPDHSLAIISDDVMRGQAGPGGYGPGGYGPGGHHGPGHHGWDPGGVQGPGPHGAGWGSNRRGMLAPPTYLWHHSTTPSQLGFVVDSPGSYGFVCTIYCGYGHPYMAEQRRLVVREG